MSFRFYWTLWYLENLWQKMPYIVRIKGSIRERCPASNLPFWTTITIEIILFSHEKEMHFWYGTQPLEMSVLPTCWPKINFKKSNSYITHYNLQMKWTYILEIWFNVGNTGSFNLRHERLLFIWKYKFTKEKLVLVSLMYFFSKYLAFLCLVL